MPKQPGRSFVALSLRIALPITLLLPFAAGCGGSSGNNFVQPNTSAPYLGAQGANVMIFSTGTSALCGKNGYINEPCTTVKICVPGSTTQCQTITDVLIDTGSVGLRVFSSALSISLTQSTIGGNALATCAQFGTGSDWGTVATADVVLAGESPVTVPIQLINKNYPGIPSQCKDADTDPNMAGFNAILGVGFQNEDCGDQCASGGSSPPAIYFSCTGSGSSATCAPTYVPKAQQIQNPPMQLGTDGNGILLATSQIDPGGAGSASGVLVLGVDTQANNKPAGVSYYKTDSAGNFTTSVSNQRIANSFIDSGSNALFFPSLGLPGCSSNGSAAGFYCPSDFTIFTAVNQASGGAGANVSFQIGNAENFLSTPNNDFNDIGGDDPNEFDWGFPFFYGRAVFEGFVGKSSSAGTGPYWEY